MRQADLIEEQVDIEKQMQGGGYMDNDEEEAEMA
jgi:hypothetical protein